MKSVQLQKLIFIYNADSGFRNAIIDGAHKIISPGTYECQLCEITFGAFKEREVWKKFRKETEIEMEFLHRDEFRKEYASKFGHKFTYPITLVVTEMGLEVFISTKELNGMTNANELILTIKERLEL